jgi:hypothetical protein
MLAGELGNEEHGRRDACSDGEDRLGRGTFLGSCRENRWVVRALRPWRRRTREGERVERGRREEAGDVLATMGWLRRCSGCGWGWRVPVLVCPSSER